MYSASNHYYLKITSILFCFKLILSLYSLSHDLRDNDRKLITVINEFRNVQDLGKQFLIHFSKK